jgi:hypothetical protein
MGILETFQDITHEKDFSRIFTAVRDFMPKVFGAKTAGFFFIDQSDPNLMYTITSVGKDEESGATYIQNVAKYPVGFGFTGKCIELRKPLIYYVDPEDHAKG